MYIASPAATMASIAERISAGAMPDGCAASIAVGAGANVLVLSRMLGHAKPSMTLDVYSDLFDADLDALGVTLDRVATT